MQVTIQNNVVNSNESMIVAVDVGKTKLNFLARVWVKGRQMTLTDERRNSNKAIEHVLSEYTRKARELGYKSLYVVCEPTGGYEQKLLATARRKGHSTEYVSGEAVNRCKSVESNDSGKTDQKDPGIIHTLASQGRTLTSRELTGSYDSLRVLNETFEKEQDNLVEIKNRLHAAVVELFVDWDRRPGFLYTNTAASLVEEFGCSPYRIVEAGWEEFSRRLRKAGRGFRWKTAAKIWRAAQSSSLHRHAAEVEHVLVERIRMLYQDYKTQHDRIEHIRAQMEELYRKLPESELLSTLPGSVSTFLLARVIAETGPLSDFRSYRQLLRYAGLNLRECKSGKYQGKIRISKKGRPVLRKVLYQIVFADLIPEGCLYSGYYQQKKQDLSNGMKAIVAVMRHFLRCIHSVGRSGQRFSCERVFKQQQDLHQAA